MMTGIERATSVAILVFAGAAGLFVAGSFGFDVLAPLR